MLRELGYHISMEKRELGWVIYFTPKTTQPVAQNL
jgi:hypothetical protein